MTFVPSDPIIAGTLQVTDVEPSTWTSDNLAVIEVQWYADQPE